MRYLVVAFFLLFTVSGAEARHYHHRHAHASVAAPCQSFDIMRPCMMGFFQPQQVQVKLLKHRALNRDNFRVHVASGQVVSHPSGCPRIAFCGCGAAVRIFGKPIRSLWLAANWFKFPRTSPHPGAVAVRRHHVFVLEADLGNGYWQVYDANSGHHATRIHPRAIAGYTIVSPQGQG